MEGSNWTLFVQGHASQGESTADGKDAFALSAMRAQEVTRSLIERGVSPKRITTVFYGDTRPDTAFLEQNQTKPELNRRVEFTLRKTDIRTRGNKVDQF